MPEEFLTIKEAAERYGKAAITIRRLIREVVKQPAAERRKFVQPDSAAVDELKNRSKPFTYTISTRLLNKEYAETDKTDRGEEIASPSGAPAAEPEIVAILKESNQHLIDQLAVKDQQIKALNQTLDAHNERQRETNVLMRGLQERLPLPPEASQPVIHATAGSTTNRSTSTSAEPNTPQQGSEPSPKHRRQTTRNKSTRVGLWRRLQGRLA